LVDEVQSRGRLGRHENERESRGIQSEGLHKGGSALKLWTGELMPGFFRGEFAGRRGNEAFTIKIDRRKERLQCQRIAYHGNR